MSADKIVVEKDIASYVYGKPLCDYTMSTIIASNIDMKNTSSDNNSFHNNMPHVNNLFSSTSSFFNNNSTSSRKC